MMCQKCRHTSDFQAELFDGPVPPLCPECMERDNLRTSHAGKRSHGIGKLRPRIVLYNEHNPDEEAIGAVVTSDLRTRPDAIVVVGTSLKIPGVKRIVREMCGVVRSRQNGVAIWINHDPVPPGKDFEDCWDLVVKADSDEVARQVDFKDWDHSSPDTPEEYTMSEVERVKVRQGEIKVIITETPRKKGNDSNKGEMSLAGMMTPPISMDGEISEGIQHMNVIKAKMTDSPPKQKSKPVMKNPASIGRSISDVLGKENGVKRAGRPKGTPNKKTLVKPKTNTLKSVIAGNVSKPGMKVPKAPMAEPEQKEPLSPRTNTNSNILLFPNLSQQYSSTEPSPTPDSPAPPEWRYRDTISPIGSIPSGMAKLLN